MYKNLNCDLLGINGRQSEIIELAMTYGFRGITIDIVDLLNRTQRTSFESASRFLTSSKLQLGGFEIPMDLDADDASYAEALGKLPAASEIAGRVNATLGVLTIPRATNRLPYPEYFDVVSQRLVQIADILAKDEVKLAISLAAPAAEEDPKEFKFVQTAESFVALIKTCTKVGAIFDSYAWYCGAGTVEMFDEIGAERIAGVYVSDCAEGVTPEAASATDCLLPGATGVIDNSTYLAKLAGVSADLPISVRGRAAEAGGKRDGFISSVQDALDQVLSQAGVSTETRKPEMFISERSFASNAD